MLAEPADEALDTVAANAPLVDVRASAAVHARARRAPVQHVAARPHERRRTARDAAVAERRAVGVAAGIGAACVAGVARRAGVERGIDAGVEERVEAAVAHR
ncbi:hypothetical protein DB32_003926 [Sandaracinus amylolyticus]|uniref:Uncharacterized protein n=1 Tax=Sandaracinus amylolyticus TaxID=927083 RepID=A0A0F6W435_9BACT|nr:hypothetical protein DB32_003926 [Sandaracinus amylolyticus]